MKKSDIYEIAVKILGLYMFIDLLHLINLVVGQIVFMSQMNPTNDVYGISPMSELIYHILHFALFTFIALFIILKSKYIVGVICKPTDFEETSTLFADRKTIYEISLTIMGLLLFIETLPELVNNIRTYIELIPQDTQEASYILASAVKLFIGFCAIIYANAIAKYLAKDNNKSTSLNPE